MKRVLIFIGLKLAEIIVAFIVSFGFYYFGEVVLKIFGKESEFYVKGATEVLSWCLGLLTILMFVILVFGLYSWLKSNWKKAGEIARRRK